MPKNDLDKFAPYLNDVLALWDELRPDFRIGNDDARTGDAPAQR